MDGLEVLKKRVKIFHELKTPAHVVTKTDTWANGYIIEISDDFFIILDRVDGKMPIFYIEVKEFDFFTGDMSTLKDSKNEGAKESERKPTDT